MKENKVPSSPSRGNIHEKSQSGLSTEDTVIILVVAVGFLGSITIYFLKLPPIIIAIFLATGISSLIYRFLGGIQNTTFNLGPVRFAGSIAALIGCAFFINGYLEDQTGYNLNLDFTPPVNTWFAMDKTSGIPVEVKIKGMNDTIGVPPLNVLTKNELGVIRHGNKLTIISETSPDFILGTLDRTGLEDIGMFNSIQRQLVGFIVTDRLPPNTNGVDLDPIPLKLSTREYGGEYSRYTLTDKRGNILHQGSIYRRQTEIVKLNGRYYLICVVEVNHSLKEGENIYAKFAVGEISLDLEL